MTKQGSPYHHDGKYNPTKTSNEAQREYATDIAEYKKSMDEIGCGIWAAIILICVIITVLISCFKDV